MIDVDAEDWAKRYAALVDPETGPLGASALSRAGLFLCGMSTCVDARIDMHDMQPLLDAPVDTPAGAFAEMLAARAARGKGGEVRADWADGPRWLREHLNIRYALGGTGAQAAWVLSRLGVASLVALEDRHEQQLRQIPPGVLLAEDGMLKPATQIRPSPCHIPEIFIFEFTAGKPIGTVTPSRSTRIIVRFCDRGIQHDAEFEEISQKRASTAAAGLLSGLNDEAIENVGAASRHVFSLSRSWMDAGLKTVHFELAGYASQDAVDELLDYAKGAITSLGMSYSELLAMNAEAQHPMDAMIALGDGLDIDRVCVHADTWAAAVTRNDPDEEELALMAGCALASARAANGEPARTICTDELAQFHPLPFESRVLKGHWTFVACASPYVEKPATTLGLGDTFTAGCLLVLGNSGEASERSASRQTQILA